MTSNYQKSGTDLDSVLAPWHSGWPQASATHLEVAGTDFDTRYAPLSCGTQVPVTGFRAVNADVNTIFAGLGTTSVQVLTQPGNVSGSSAAGNPSGVVTSNAATCAGAKGGGSYTYTWHTTGCTATSPNSATSTFYATVNAGTTDSGSAYCTISDGVTSANTDTISAALQNTTSAFLYNGTITSGEVETDPGGSGQIISYGYGSGWDGDEPFGSLSPTTDTNGHAIAYVYGVLIGLVPDQTRNFTIAIESSSSLGQSYFTTLTVTVGGTKYSLSSSAASYSYSEGASQWVWSGDLYITGSGQTVPLTYV